jgi:hypothetical protein
MTVYITQEVRGRDLSDALGYGDLEILIPAKEQVSFSARSMVQQIESKLKAYTSDDYLMLSGDPVCIGVACAIAAKENNGHFNVLKWDRLEEKYYSIEVDLNQHQEQESFFSRNREAMT